jgi:hypothetical protein
MVTCMTCRHEVDDGGHLANCPILIDELRKIRMQALLHAPKELPRG